MPVQVEPSGRRSVQVEVEVKASHEDAWNAVATGPGISAWFVPTEFEIGEDGVPTKSVSHFGPGMDSIGKVTAWEPPHRFEDVGEAGDMGPGFPAIATEWVVEAKAGGTCVIRVVHSLFATTDEWDAQIESFQSGWPAFFRILRLYLEEFPGQPGSALQANAVAPEPAEEAWKNLLEKLGLEGVTSEVSRAVETGPGAPKLRGTVVPREKIPGDELLLLVDQPGPGVAHLFAMPMGGMVYLSVRVFLYGEGLAETAAREETVWKEWLAAEFPAPEGAEPQTGCMTQE